MSSFSYEIETASDSTRLHRASTKESMAAAQGKIISELKAFGFYNCEFFVSSDDKGHGSGFVATSDFAQGEGENVCIIVFRGTHNNTDVRTDLSYEMIKIEGDHGYVHKGFHEAVSDVSMQIAAIVNRLNPKHTLPILVTGHSLGGANAVMAAFAAQESYKAIPALAFDVHAVYTFGQPRVGDTSFKASYDKTFKEKTFRIARGADVIPSLPPTLCCYHHVGEQSNLLYFNTCGTGHWNRSCHGRCLDDCVGMSVCCTTMGYFIVTAHSMNDGYRSDMRKHFQIIKK